MNHRTDAIRYYGLDLGEGDKTVMSGLLGGNPYAQYQNQLQQYMQMAQGAAGISAGTLVLNTIKPMPVGPKINDLLLLVEEGDV